MYTWIPWLAFGLLLLAAFAVWSKRRRMAPAWTLVVALAVGVLVAMVSRRASPPPLTAQDLAAARERWRVHGPNAYEIELRVHADRLESAQYVIVVRDGVVVGSRRDGTPVASAEDAYSVTGLFEMLEREIELAAQPQSGFGAPAGFRAYLYARFDPENGRPIQYRRTVGGTSNGVEIQVERFATGN